MFYAISKSSVLLLSISCFSLTALVSMDVSFGIWRAIRWLIFVLLGGRVLGEYGIYHHIHPVIFYHYSASVFLREVCRRSMNFLRTCVSHSTEVQLQLQSFTLKQLFSEESCSVVGLSEKVSFQLRSELSATVEQ